MFVPTDRIETLSNRASSLLELARQEFGTLTNAEEKLFRAAANGEIADYSADFEEDNYPARAEFWGEERLLKAGRIAWLCTDPQASALVTHRGILVKGARIDGKLDLRFAKIPFPIDFQKSAFPEGIDLESAEIRALALPGTHTGPIDADGVKVENYVFLGNGFKAEGEVRLPCATIGGALTCTNGQFINQEGYALIASGVKVEGSVYLRYGFKAEGKVSLPCATVGGDLDCRGGQFINQEGYALFADRLKVEGGVFLRDGFKAEGEVRLPYATVGGALDCTKAQFINQKGYALFADGVKVEGSVYLRNGFKAEGKVCLVNAKVKDHLILAGVVSSTEMALDLRYAKLGTLWDDSDSWPESGKLFLHGLVYDKIDEKAPTDAQIRIDWLHRQPDFQPQPYEQLAAVLRESGRDEDTKRILIEKNKDRARLTQLTFLKRCNHCLLGWVVGYGYRPWRAFLWVLAVIVLGWFLFGIGLKTNVMVPTKKEAYVSINDDNGRELSAGYPHFKPLVYSLDMFVPLIDLHQARYWLPNGNQKSEWLIWRELPIGELLWFYLRLHIAAGWILTTLLVVSLSGLIKD